MKTLFLECNMGATDTMLLSSLYDACEDKAAFFQHMDEAFAPFGITTVANPVSKCGVFGTRISFYIEAVATAASVAADTSEKKIVRSAKNEAEEHLNYLLAHAMNQHEQEREDETASGNTNGSINDSAKNNGSDYSEENSSVLPTTIDELTLPDSVKESINAIYQLLNEATSALHQPTKSPLPLNTKEDAELLANIAGCALLVHLIAPEQITCSPLHIGNGFAKSGDAVVSVPAPITATLLKGIPCYTSNIVGCLLDEANAAILKYFVTQFGVMPAMTIQNIGYGIGTNDFAIANYVRAFSGDTQMSGSVATNTSTASIASATNTLDEASEESFSDTDTIVSIACNIDDMTGEALSLATEILLVAGAIDVYTATIQMKKNRPGVLLTCLCEAADREKFIGLLFLHTTAQEVRYQTFTRVKLESTIVSRHSSYGNVRVKKSSGYGIEKEKLEFEDLKTIVLKNGITIADIEFDE